MRRLGITVGSLVLIAGCGIAYASYAAARRRREPRGLRVSPRRSVPLQREMVELSGSAGRASAARRAAQRFWDARGRARGAARTAGQPRLGHRRARARRRLLRGSSAIGNRASLARGAGPRRRRGRRARLLAVAGADDRRRSPSSGPRRCSTTSCRCSVSYARFGVVVQLMAALLAGIGVDCLRRAGTRRAQIAVHRARRARRRRVRVAPSALWRDVLPDGGAPLGDAAARARAGPRLHAAQSGIGIGAVADRRSRDAARQRRSSDCDGAEPAAEARGDRLHAPARAARHADGRTGSHDHAAAGWPARRRAIRRRAGVRGHGADAGDLHGGDDRVLSARARCGVVVAMDGRRCGLDDREHQRRADRRDPRPRTVGVPPRAPAGAAARRARRADARRRAVAPHLPASARSTIGPGRPRARRFIRPKRRRWPAT